MINHISILGTGQVGTSIALALSQTAPHLKISMYDCDQATPDLVRTRFQELGIKTDSLSFATTPENAVKDSDLVILATPLNVMGDLTRRILPALSPSVILTDTGSAKEEAIKTITTALRGSGIAYVPAHPGNGSQGSGPLTGSPGNILGANSWMFIIEEPGQTDEDFPAQKTLREFWQGAQVQVATTDAVKHDQFFGTCSHLQHAIAFSLLNARSVNPVSRETLKESGTAFLNLTRMAMGKLAPGQASAVAAMWQPIFTQNQHNIVTAGSKFMSYFDYLVASVKADERAEIIKSLNYSHDVRKAMHDPEPREDIGGEISDIARATDPQPGKATLRDVFGYQAINDLYVNLLMPIALAHAQTLNARDVDVALVSGKANPSFRDGTAAALFDPTYAAHLLLEHKDAFLQAASDFRQQLTMLLKHIEKKDIACINAAIVNAQEVRNEMPGPRKGDAVRAENLMLKVA